MQLSLFGGTTSFKIDKPIRLIELFGGISCQAQALLNLGVDFENYRYCDFDKYACQSHNEIMGTNDKPSDITKWKGEDLGVCDTDKYCYIMTYSFPCTDLSTAGKMAGMERGSGTRSGLLWEVERLLKECKELPQVLLMENVPQVHGKKNKASFDEWCQFLESLGYKNYWKDLNAKDYGVPQSRNRCFMVSLLGDYSYEFPDPIELKLKLQDLLEDEVDKKYYLSSKLIEFYTNNTEMQEQKGNGFKFEPLEDASIAKTITTRSGSRMTDNYIKENHECGNRQPKIMIEKIDIPQIVKVRKHDVNIEKLKQTLKNHKKLNIKEIAKQLDKPITTVEHWFRADDCFSIPDADIWFELKKLLGIKTDEFDLPITEFERREGVFEKSNRYYFDTGLSPTLTSSSADEKIICTKLLGGAGEKRSNNGTQYFMQDIIYEGNISNAVCTCANPYYKLNDNLKTQMRNKLIQEGKVKENDVIRHNYTTSKNGNCVQSNNESPTLDTRCDCLGVCVKTNNKRQRELANKIDLAKDNQFLDFYNQSSQTNIAGTITTRVDASNSTGIYKDYRIRKLTPTECLRLMGVRDEYSKRMTCSNAQKYKQAGNGIVVDVLMEIFKKML